MTWQSISAYESGEKTPEAATFAALAQELEQPTSFFTSQDRTVFGPSRPSFFRKFGPDTVRRNEACGILGHWYTQVAKYLDEFVNFPVVDVPEAAPKDVSGRYSIDEIEEIAARTRKHWGLGLGPISNVLSLIESRGVSVCRHVIEGEQVEAFSFWNGERPFVFMASEKESGARVRFDLAHELGHLILHRWIEPEELQDPTTLKIIEGEADRFASAFLLPLGSFPNEVYTARLDVFLDLKMRWRVSIQAMIYRCRDLQLIDEAQFTNLYKQVSYRKWRKREPMDDPEIITLEQPRLLKRAMELVLDGGRKHQDEVVADLTLNPRLLEAFCNLPRGMLSGESTNNPEPTLK